MPDAPLILRGGQAVPPREVEQVLLGHPAVAEVAVVGVPDRLWGEIVGAAVRLSAPLSAATDLSLYCRAFVAGYKVPERWLLTRALPRTPSGEVCRATLTAQLTASPPPGLSGKGTSTAGLTMMDPIDLFRPRAAIEDLRVPQQVRRSWALEDL